MASQTSAARCAGAFVILTREEMRHTLPFAPFPPERQRPEDERTEVSPRETPIHQATLLPPFALFLLPFNLDVAAALRGGRSRCISGLHSCVARSVPSRILPPIRCCRETSPVLPFLCLLSPPEENFWEIDSACVKIRRQPKRHKKSAVPAANGTRTGEIMFETLRFQICYMYFSCVITKTYN